MGMDTSIGKSLGARAAGLGFNGSVARAQGFAGGAPDVKGTFNAAGTYGKKLPDGRDERTGLGPNEGPTQGGDGFGMQIILNATAHGWPLGAQLYPEGFAGYSVDAGDILQGWGSDRMDAHYLAYGNGTVYGSALQWEVAYLVTHPPDTPPVDPGPVTPVDVHLAQLHGKRFGVTVTYGYGDKNVTPPHLVTGSATAYPGGTLPGDTTGLFWFLGADNLEVVVKVLGPSEGYWWVFVASASSFAYTITIADAKSGLSWTHTNPRDTFASFADFRAFKD